VLYSPQEVIDVSTADGVRVGQIGASGHLEFMVHQFKYFVGFNGACEIKFAGQASLAPSYSPVYMQIFNRLTSLWETIASNNTERESHDFELIAEKTDLTNYKDSDSVVAGRVWQRSTA